MSYRLHFRITRDGSGDSYSLDKSDSMDDPSTDTWFQFVCCIFDSSISIVGSFVISDIDIRHDIVLDYTGAASSMALIHHIHFTNREGDSFLLDIDYVSSSSVTIEADDKEIALQMATAVRLGL